MNMDLNAEILHQLLPSLPGMSYITLALRRIEQSFDTLDEQRRDKIVSRRYVHDAAVATRCPREDPPVQLPLAL